MQYLHDDMHISHRDLKHSNILMGRVTADPENEEERQPTIKICDFTTAIVLPEEQTEEFTVTLKQGTLPFSAPE